jgi:hypothetical protein
MSRNITTRVGRVLVIASIALMFMVYSNFAPTALGSDRIADYVKNDFVREMIYGAYFLHGPQVALFYAGIALLWFRAPSSSES